MLAVLLLAFLLPLGAGLYPLFEGGRVWGQMLVWALPGGLGTARVVYAWVSNPDGIKDYSQGGVVGFRDTPYRLTWYDWAIFVTRRGTIEKGSRTLRLERRLLFGLIPLGNVERPLDDFYRVAVDRDRIERSRGEGIDRRKEVVGFVFTLRLVDRQADGLTVLDVTEGSVGSGGAQLVGELRAALEQALAGEPRRRRRADPEPASAPDDFEAWRRQQEQDG